MATISIRNAPEELTKRLRIAAATKGKTIREFVIEALQEKLNSHREKRT